MSSKRALRRKQCERKVAHATEADALFALHRTGRGPLEASRAGLAVYHCDNCGRWHVGHREGSRSIGTGLRKAHFRGRVGGHS